MHPVQALWAEVDRLWSAWTNAYPEDDRSIVEVAESGDWDKWCAEHSER